MVREKEAQSNVRNLPGMKPISFLSPNNIFSAEVVKKPIVF